MPAEPELNPELLNRALGYMAAFLVKRRQQLVVVGVGGAVNVILLRTRPSTHDVDFFNQNLTPKQAALLTEATSFARRQMSTARRIELPVNWFNNRTVIFIPSHLRAELTREAQEQQEVVFEAPGLTVLAAPWPYAFCSKVNRMSGGDSRSYDVADAASYLHRYLNIHKMKTIPIDDVRAWGTKYGIAMADEQLRVMEDVYSQLYNSGALAW